MKRKLIFTLGNHANIIKSISTKPNDDIGAPNMKHDGHSGGGGEDIVLKR